MISSVNNEKLLAHYIDFHLCYVFPDEMSLSRGSRPRSAGKSGRGQEPKNLRVSLFTYITHFLVIEDYVFNN